MEQYPSPAFPDDNYSYQYGIYLTCDPESKYVRAYDESTRAFRFSDCSCNGGCDPGDDRPLIAPKEVDKPTPPVPVPDASSSILLLYIE